MKRPSTLFFATLLWSGFFASHALATTLVYVSESKDQKIAVFSLDESTGDLTRIGETEVGGAPGCLTTSADGKYLYSSVRSNSTFGTHTIDPKTGLLTKVNFAPSLGSASYIYPDKTGKWLLAAYYGDGLASVSKIEDGVVRGKVVSSMDVGKKAHCIQVDPANRIALIPHPVPLNKVSQLAFDAKDGSLKPNKIDLMKGDEGAGPRHLQFHPNGKWVYVVNEQGKSVSLCDYDAAAGTLKLRKTLSSHPSDWDPKSGSCADIEISADGKFVYASNRGHDSIGVFQIDPENGELTSLGQTPTEKTPRSFNLIPGGENFVVSAGQGSNKLVVYRRNSETGKLSPLKTYDCGQSPAWVLGVKLN